MLIKAEGHKRLQSDFIIAFVCFYEKKKETIDKLFSIFEEDEARFVLVIYKNHLKGR